MVSSLIDCWGYFARNQFSSPTISIANPVNYRSQTPAKFYANLKPDVGDPTMRNKAHLDNISVIGRALQGDGTMKFSLRGKAPMERGEYRREITLGLMDHEKWMMQPPLVHYSYPFVIVVK